jgi:hypothetical protein
VVVDNLMIHGIDEFDAQRKLRQVYHNCQIIDCVCHHGSVRVPVPASRKSQTSLFVEPVSGGSWFPVALLHVRRRQMKRAARNSPINAM